MTVIRQERPINQWAGLAAVVAVLTACAVQPAGDSDSPREEPDPQIAAGTRDAWWPADSNDPPALRPSFYGTAGGASPAGAAPAKTPETGSVNRPDSDMAGAIDSVPSAQKDADKSYVIPAVEIVGYEFLLNQWDRRFVDHGVYATGSRSIRDNLHRGWIIDRDPFSMNQFGHPYSGSIYHGFARSAGLDYWESLGYDFVGSALWELAGETGPPSLNDQLTTTLAGSFLGEALFRTSNLVLAGGEGKPGPFRTLFASLISPSAAINRFGGLFESHDPATFSWVGVGGRRNTTLNDPGVLSHITHNQGVAAFSLDYGLPGKPGYKYERPFDYFHFEAAATSSANAFPESIVVRGLLYGTDYSSGPDYHAIWGLYGSYDYFSPEIFKVSSTALSAGTTGQYLISEKFALQDTGMLGVGFTAAGTTANERTDRRYRYGATPQALLALRLVYSDIAMIDMTANDYLISGDNGSAGTTGSENILRAQLSLTVRVYGQHALGIQFVESRRGPHFTGIPSPRQTVGALTLFYEFLGDEKFGVVRK